MLIFLIGLPGSGKTTLGKQLAKKLNYSFSDLDEKIVHQYQTSIEEIFATKGELSFRLYEKECLQSYDAKDSIIISTGGGAPCFHHNMEWMNAHGLTIYLNPPLSELSKRLSIGNNAHRPMLKNLTPTGLLDFLDHKYQERNPYYAQAQLIIDKENPSVQDLLEKINPLLNQ